MRTGPGASPVTRRVVKAGTAALFEVRSGQTLTVKDLEGKQVADFIALNAGDLTEYLSTCQTRSMIGRLYLRKGDQLFSSLKRAMFTLVEDDVGAHDLLFAACDPGRYLYSYGVKDHRNCRDNFHALLGPYGVRYGQIPDPVNFFENVPVNPDGSFGITEPLSRPGDKVVLKVEMDAIVLVSACPMDLNPCNGWKPTDIEVSVEG